jgi:GNAT superfamily N-acetyltransferase
MSRLVVIPVTTLPQRKQFLELPWQIYRDDPNWIPPLRTYQREMVNYRRQAFYDDAEIQTFLALRDGEPCGRVAAILNHAHNRYHREQRGFFGFFESIDSHAVASSLLDAARAWLAERGIHAVRGPANPSLNYECGLLIDGFDSPPFFMMTYNPPYYPRLIEDYGFRKVQDMYAFWGHIDMLSSIDEKLSYVTDEAKRRFKITLRSLNKRHFRQDVERFLDVYNRSLVATWGFVPLSKNEIRQLAGTLRHLIVPELTYFAEVEGRTVGVVFGLLDYNPRIKQIDGRLLPLGFLRLLRNRREIKRIRVISTNVLPEYQRWGVGLVLLSGLVPSILNWGIEEAEFSWVLESNTLSYGSLKKGGAKVTKTYRIYDFEPGQEYSAGATAAETASGEGDELPN